MMTAAGKSEEDIAEAVAGLRGEAYQRASACPHRVTAPPLPRHCPHQQCSHSAPSPRPWTRTLTHSYRTRTSRSPFTKVVLSTTGVCRWSSLLGRSLQSSAGLVRVQQHVQQHLEHHMAAAREHQHRPWSSSAWVQVQQWVQ
jgi:hypothetical protein